MTTVDDTTSARTAPAGPPPLGTEPDPGTERWPVDRRLRRVRRYVHRHFAESLPLERVASVAGLERSYFSRYFHDKTGVCFHDWLRSVRIAHALSMMETEDMTLTQIAFATGFGDLRTFERACEKSTGLCPKSARRRIRQRP